MRARTNGECRAGSGYALWVAAALSVLTVAGQVAAAPGDPACLAKKLKQWGKLRRCEMNENGKALRGLPADPAKCRTKFTKKLSGIDTSAANAGVACRFGDNADGTIIDYDTGLQWEQKTEDGDTTLHDRDLTFNWSSGAYVPDFTYPDGDAFVEFLASLNACESADNGATLTGGFAGHCDWRLPTLPELIAISDPSQPGCGTAAGDCIDESVFGPAPEVVPNPPSYWSSTILPPSVDFPNYAWGMSFTVGFPFITPRNSGMHVRAVRSAL